MLHLWGTFPHSGRDSPRLLTLCPHNSKLEGGTEGVNIIQVRKTEARLFPDTELKSPEGVQALFATPHNTPPLKTMQLGKWGAGVCWTPDPWAIHSEATHASPPSSYTGPRSQSLKGTRVDCPLRSPHGIFFFPAPLKSFHFTGGKFPHSVTTPERGPDKITWELITHP